MMRFYNFIFCTIAITILGFGIDFYATTEEINQLNLEQITKLETELNKCQNRCMMLAKELDKTENQKNLETILNKLNFEE